TKKKIYSSTPYGAYQEERAGYVPAGSCCHVYHSLALSCRRNDHGYIHFLFFSINICISCWMLSIGKLLL
uniref:Uncharacterized protein n=1 Tax=Aegilops tauschii subsp. strangulata TaxID=200361 RepID=A0A453QG80_AEGTS